MHNFAFRQLKPDELDAAYAIVTEVTEWLLQRGIRQWLQPLPLEIYAARQNKGENYGLMVDDQLAAVISLMDFRPEYWAEYLPKKPFKWVATLASARRFKGQKLGELTLSEAEHYLTTEGVPAVWLDCLYGEGALPAFYTMLGYQQVARKEIRFPLGSFDGVLLRKKLKS